MDIYLLAQNDTWRFDTSVTDQYRITVTCDDGKTGGTTTATTLISLLSNQAPVISNVPRTFKLVAGQPANALFPALKGTHSTEVWSCNTIKKFFFIKKLYVLVTNIFCVSKLILWYPNLSSINMATRFKIGMYLMDKEKRY